MYREFINGIAQLKTWKELHDIDTFDLSNEISHLETYLKTNHSTWYIYWEENGTVNKRLSKRQRRLRKLIKGYKTVLKITECLALRIIDKYKDKEFNKLIPKFAHSEHIYELPFNCHYETDTWESPVSDEIVGGQPACVDYNTADYRIKVK